MAWRRHPNLVFLHVPKCAGTSLDAALARAYGRRSIHIPAQATRAAADRLADGAPTVHDVAAVREALLLTHMHGGAPYIGGHLFFSPAAWSMEGYRFVTLLRDPVDRWVSHYFYDRYKSHGHTRVHDDLDAFLDTDKAWRLGATMVRMLAGPADEPDVARAIANLRRFDAVGFLDDLGGFRRDLAALGVPVRRLGRQRANPRRREDIQAEVAPHLDCIRDLCRPDQALYDAARHAAPTTP